MSAIKRLIDSIFPKRSLENPQVPITSSEILRLFSAEPSKAGQSVDEKTALRNVAVFACIRVLSETPASLPLFVYRRLKGGGKERAVDHPTYSMLHDMANPEMTAMSLRETVQAHAVSWGNGYAYIVREDGWAKELWPLTPDKTNPVRVKGELAYEFYLPSGERRMLNPVDVLHIPGLGFDGLRGYSPIRLAREAIGLGLAAEEFGARFFGQGTNLGGIVEHPGKLGAQAHENLKTSLSQSYQGLGKAHLLLVLEEGMKYQKIGIPPNDAQFLETRKMQVTEIARLFRVPPHLIADLDRATYSNIEHMAIDFVVHTLRPWLVRWEQAMNYKLFTPKERKEYFAEHLIDGLLRGDAKSRAEALATLRQNGIINADEWRAMENMNPQEGGTGKYYLVNGNMITVDAAGQPFDARKQPQPEGVEQRNAQAANTSERLMLAKAYRGLFVDAAQRIVRRERADISKAGLKVLAEGGEARFVRWLEEYYAAAPEWITRTITPVVTSYAEAMQAAAAKQVNASQGKTPTLDAFMRKYIEAFTVRYTASSLGQLKDVVAQSVAQNANHAQAIETRLGEWEERRPGKVAMNETVQAGNAFALTVFQEAGVRRVRWQNTGSELCPYCSELHGRVVEAGNPFVSEGETLHSEDGRMSIYRPASHPPLHLGCNCLIMPV